MQPNWMTSLGAGRAKTDEGTIVGAVAETAAALMKLRRFMRASLAGNYHAPPALSTLLQWGQVQVPVPLACWGQVLVPVPF